MQLVILAFTRKTLLIEGKHILTDQLICYILLKTLVQKTSLRALVSTCF